MLTICATFSLSFSKSISDDILWFAKSSMMCFFVVCGDWLATLWFTLLTRERKCFKSCSIKTN